MSFSLIVFWHLALTITLPFQCIHPQARLQPVTARSSNRQEGSTCLLGLSVLDESYTVEWSEKDFQKQ